MTGPQPGEVTRRETFDAVSGQLLDVTHDYPSCRDKCADLPSPRPRPIRTVFHFLQTKAKVPQSSAGGHADATPATGGPRVIRLADHL